MKFRIKYADQIVGTLSILAIVALVFVIFMLGNKQRWFAKDYDFKTTFESATGISVGMSIQYKGFTIGKIKSLKLDNKDLVDVTFSIFDIYYDRVRKGSLIELVVSPIGLGNQVLFYPGKGASLIPEYSFIPRTDSPEGLAMIEKGLIDIPKRNDTITNVIAQINPLLTNLNETLAVMNGAFKGTGKGPLAETMNGAAKTLTNVSGITEQVYGSMGTILVNVKGITANLESLSDQMHTTKGLVPAMIDPDGKIFGSIQTSLNSVEGMMNNLEGSSSVLKSEMPQLGRLMEDLRVTLDKAQDVLEGLKNNPLLKNGIPQRTKTDSSGTSSRNIDF